MKKLVQFFRKKIYYSISRLFNNVGKEVFEELHAKSISKILTDLDKILIVAPHFDDEVLGCYNLMAENPKIKFDIVFVTDSSGSSRKRYNSEQRKKESINALRDIKNINSIIYLGIPDQKTKELEIEYKSFFQDKEIEYDYILIPASWDLTEDHANISNTVRNTCVKEKIIFYRSTFYTFKNKEASFLSIGPLENKLVAIKSFKSQNHLALFNPIIFSSIRKSIFSRTYTVECFLFASEAHKSNKENLNTLGNLNLFRFENFTCK